MARRINERIRELKEKLISEEEFETVRKKQYGKTVRAFSDIDIVANSLVVSHFENEELFSEFDVIRSLDLKYVNNILLNSFDEDKAVLSVVSAN